MRTKRWHPSVYPATLFGVGFVPKIPGTVASFVTLFPAYWLSSQGPGLCWAVTICVAILAVPVCGRAARALGQSDPRCIVLDEVAGMLIAFAPFSIITPDGERAPIHFLLITFAWFRYFDVQKPVGIDQVQSLRGGWGIVADDVLAGIYAAAAGILFYYLGVFAVPMAGN